MILTTHAMKTQKNFEVKPGASPNIRHTLKKTKPVHMYTGLIQENYVNPRYLGAGMVASISNMSFGGLWM
jgi:hypothetical protein